MYWEIVFIMRNIPITETRDLTAIEIVSIINIDDKTYLVFVF